MRIVGIHGIGQYRPDPPAQVARFLSLKWSRALAKSPSLPWTPGRFTLDVAYYSHLFIRPGVQSGDALAPDDEELLAEFLRDYMPAIDVFQGPLTWPLRQAVAAFARHHGLPEEPTGRFLGRLVTEVGHFLRTAGGFTPKQSVIDSVATIVEGADIVFAHSLGSVVAYETLWQHHLRVPLLVTIGSPLAMPTVVFPRLSPSPVNGMGTKPPGVERWINLADHGDIVAIPVNGVSKQFTGIDATDDHATTIAPVDFHKAVNYLSCRKMGEILATAAR